MSLRLTHLPPLSNLFHLSHSLTYSSLLPINRPTPGCISFWPSLSCCWAASSSMGSRSSAVHRLYCLACSLRSSSKRSLDRNYTMAGVEAGAALLVLGLFFFVIPRRYELTEAALVLVLGFRWHIPYENIVSIEEVDLFAGVCACKFSLSIDNRLRIERRSGLPVWPSPLQLVVLGFSLSCCLGDR
eukprot:m.279645 g.279645  ORF g.279645 m.279645 type:complete len:186 (-) comp54907_c0_seq7:88-645(-)